MTTFTRDSRSEPPDKKKAPRPEPAGRIEKNVNRNYKRLPAFGREVSRAREAGQVPNGVVVIAVGLWIQDQLLPGHRLIVPDDLEVARLDLRLVAGLSSCIVHDESRTKRARALVDPIIAVCPEWLAIANIESRFAATAFELGAPCCRFWREWEWARFDGQQPLTLPNPSLREAA